MHLGKVLHLSFIHSQLGCRLYLKSLALGQVRPKGQLEVQTQEVQQKPVPPECSKQVAVIIFIVPPGTQH